MLPFAPNCAGLRLGRGRDLRLPSQLRGSSWPCCLAAAVAFGLGAVLAGSLPVVAVVLCVERPLGTGAPVQQVRNAGFLQLWVVDG
jgi:hypothetical protein